jgi:hypothetical protein
MDWVPKGEITVRFEEGKTCEELTTSPVKFKLDKKYGCYVTDFLKMGETSSLTFMQAGDYSYKVTAPESDDLPAEKLPFIEI